MQEDKKRLLVLDGNAIVHRAYHALPPLTTKKGELVGAIYGFLLVFFRAVKEFKPDFVAAAFDFPAPTFRHKKYKLYKAKRPKAPEDLSLQIPKVKSLLESFNVKVFEKEGYEADDIIGTIAKLACRQQVLPEIETIIVSGDFDVLQLVDKNTKVWALKRGIKDIVFYDEKAVQEKYQGLGPKHLLDFKALRGDSSDNIPGVTGIGEITAINLIKAFGSLDNLYRALEEKKDKAKEVKPQLIKKILDYKDQAFVSRMLAEINRSVPVDFNLEKCRWPSYDKNKAREALEGYEFYSLLKRLAESGKDNNFENKEKTAKKDIKNNLKLW